PRSGRSIRSRTGTTCWRASRRRGPSSRRRPVPGEYTYDYAIIRLVPRVDRGEQVNVGVVLSCADTEFLDSRIELNEEVVRAIDPEIDLAAGKANLEVIPAVCRGGPEAGPIGMLPPRGRFRWLVSPRSTIIQPSAVHT